MFDVCLLVSCLGLGWLFVCFCDGWLLVLLSCLVLLGCFALRFGLVVFNWLC